jgi:hypothetical protein
LKGKYLWGYLSANGIMIIKWILKKQDMREWTGFIWLSSRLL